MAKKRSPEAIEKSIRRRKHDFAFMVFNEIDNLRDGPKRCKSLEDAKERMSKKYSYLIEWTREGLEISPEEFMNEYNEAYEAFKQTMKEEGRPFRGED